MIKINTNIFRNNLVEYALTFINKKYTWGACGPNEFDCSGFTWYIYKTLFDIDITKNGHGLNNTTKQMTSNIGNLVKYASNDKKKKKYINNLNLGDLVFFHKKNLNDNTSHNNNYSNHVGIYIGNNEFIHASLDKDKVVINTFDNYWLKILVASKDIIGNIYKNNDFIA